MKIILMVSIIILAICLTKIAADNNCSCGYYDEVDRVGPFCRRWVEDGLPFCLLSGGLSARSCDGAVQWGNDSLYWTEDEDICKKSIDNVPKNCSCGYYDEDDWIGPFCARWLEDDSVTILSFIRRVFCKIL